MTQLRHLRRLVRSRLGVPIQDQMFTDDQLDDHINLAIETIEAEQRWPWQEHVETVTVTLNEPEIPLHPRWRATRAVYLDDNERTELALVSPTDILSWRVDETPESFGVHQQAVGYGAGLWGSDIYGQELTVGVDIPRTAAVTGRPQEWAPIGDLIVLRPWPSGPMQLVHYFYTGPEWLRDDDAEPAIPDHYHGAIVAKAAELLSVREDDRAGALTHVSDYEAWIDRMRRDVRRSTTPVRVRVRPGGWLE